MASSPWGAVVKAPESASLQDIMSEEVARDMQNKENVKYAKHLAEKHMPTDTKNENVISPDLLKQLEQESAAGFCDSDSIIAQMLQTQFDHEYEEQIKINEKKRNGLYKYKMIPDQLLEEPEHETNARETEDWDEFENNEKEFADIPRCGYKVVNDGKMVTKHDMTISSRRNACKVMAFPPEFQTGDAASFDMKLSNRVFNSLKAHSRSQQSKRNKMLDRKESHATAELGVDEPTRLLLYKLVNNGMLQKINGVISTGKESVVLHADSDPTYTEFKMPPECAIKVFKTTLNEFKTRDKYIKDDYRFKDRFCKLNPRKVIHMWAEKEMHNIMRMQKLGIKCPEVVCLKKHILVMSFIGENNRAAPKLKDAILSSAEWITAYEEIVESMHRMYNKGHLIHADLSEYNILWHEGQCWFIDVSQGVEPEHPSALEFLLRDCTNISLFFSKKGVPKVKTAGELFEYITGMEGRDLEIYERIHFKGLPPHQVHQGTDEVEESKRVTYPFEFAWEQSCDDKSEDIRSKRDLCVEHNGLRDEFEEMWNKTREKKVCSEPVPDA